MTEPYVMAISYLILVKTKTVKRALGVKVEA